VVKGPGSALYGSEAMGGIINVITKDPVLATRLALDLMSTTWQEHNADVGFALGKGKLRSLTGINGFVYDAPRDDNRDGFTDMTLQKRVSLFEKLTLLRPGKRTASLAMRVVGEDRWGGEMDWTPAFAGGDSLYGETIATRRWELIGQYQLPFAEQVMLQVSANGHHQGSWYGTTCSSASCTGGIGMPQGTMCSPAWPTAARSMTTARRPRPSARRPVR
jgi:outer membrane receptor for ferrienterochelin and colicins